MVLGLGLIQGPQPAVLVFVLPVATMATILIRASAVPVTPILVLIVAMATAVLVVAAAAVADF